MKYSPEMIDFILNNYKNISSMELTERFNDFFKTNVTIGQMQSFKCNRGLKSGYCSKFKKGVVPHNKGKRMSEEHYKKAAPTMFKKGHVPSNIRPVGSERISRDGYIEVKVSQNKWEKKHRAVWESVYGSIPKDCIILFLDGNKQNCDISNLEMIKRREGVLINKQDFHFKNADMTKSSIALVKYQRAVYDLKKTNLKEKKREGQKVSL